MSIDKSLVPSYPGRRDVTRDYSFFDIEFQTKPILPDVIFNGQEISPIWICFVLDHGVSAACGSYQTNTPDHFPQGVLCQRFIEMGHKDHRARRLL